MPWRRRRHATRHVLTASASPVPSRPAKSPSAREPVSCTPLQVVGLSHTTLALGLLVALDEGVLRCGGLCAQQARLCALMAGNVDHGCVVLTGCCSLYAAVRSPAPPACRGCWPLAAAFRLPSHAATRPATPAESRARTASWTTLGPPSAWAPWAAASGTLARESTTRPGASRTGPWAASRCVSASTVSLVHNVCVGESRDAWVTGL